MPWQCSSRLFDTTRSPGFASNPLGQFWKAGVRQFSRAPKALRNCVEARHCHAQNGSSLNSARLGHGGKAHQVRTRLLGSVAIGGRSRTGIEIPDDTHQQVGVGRIHLKYVFVNAASTLISFHACETLAANLAMACSEGPGNPVSPGPTIRSRTGIASWTPRMKQRSQYGTPW